MYIHLNPAPTPAPLTVEWQGETLTVHFSRYASGNLRIDLRDADGFPFATCTTDLPGKRLTSQVAYIKDYSENIGVLDLLIRNKIISEPLGYMPSGYVRIPMCRVLVEVAK